MKKLHLFITLILSLTLHYGFAQKVKSDANIVGHVVNTQGQHLPFASVNVKGTAIGTTTDETGHYQLINLPEGNLTIEAHFLGYKPVEKEVVLVKGKTIEVKFELPDDLLGLEEIVITGDRNETNRHESSIIVNTLNPKLFSSTQSITLSEGLNFCPGLRTENDCQNCGFTQLRINGMEGPYSQILINNRPIFSGLAGVYGLELIPSSMIERVEVVRGGGSALYGSNAIAGTVNLILKDPINDSYEFGLNGGMTGIGSSYDKPAKDFSINLNGSVTSGDDKTGMSLYGFYRNREPFDANNDSFSELSSIQNATIGSRVYHRFSSSSKIILDFFNLNEKRRGGDKHDELPHMSGITEAVDHNILSGAVTFEIYLRSADLLSIYASGQGVKRNSYYGAEESLKDYGKTRDQTYNAGVQYHANFNNSSLLVGIEETHNQLTDKKLGYPDLEGAVINFEDSSIIIPTVGTRVVSDQSMNTFGIFMQYEITIKKFKLSAGARYDNYQIRNFSEDELENKGNVISPRITMKFDIMDYLQARLSYSQGYRAPQIFDEDLHILTSAARQVIHVNDPGLEEEKSHSVMASLDFNKRLGEMDLGILAEGFYTRLNNAFSQEIGEPDEDGTVIYTRVNAENGAVVQGINLEFQFVPSAKFNLKGGFTLQSSQYEEPQEFDEKRFLRTPGNYGYLTLYWQPLKKFGLSSTANYTGTMLVPYFGPLATDPEQGELHESEPFLDMGLKVWYNIKLNGATLRLFAGIKNIFNAYQDDFDAGIDRDPGYIYGPASPRTIYAGIKIGNMLQ